MIVQEDKKKIVLNSINGIILFGIIILALFTIISPIAKADNAAVYNWANLGVANYTCNSNCASTKITGPTNPKINALSGDTISVGFLFKSSCGTPTCAGLTVSTVTDNNHPTPDTYFLATRSGFCEVWNQGNPSTCTTFENIEVWFTTITTNTYVQPLTINATFSGTSTDVRAVIEYTTTPVTLALDVTNTKGVAATWGWYPFQSYSLNTNIFSPILTYQAGESIIVVADSGIIGTCVTGTQLGNTYTAPIASLATGNGCGNQQPFTGTAWFGELTPNTQYSISWTSGNVIGPQNVFALMLSVVYSPNGVYPSPSNTLVQAGCIQKLTTSVLLAQKQTVAVIGTSPSNGFGQINITVYVKGNTAVSSADFTISLYYANSVGPISPSNPLFVGKNFKNFTLPPTSGPFILHYYPPANVPPNVIYAYAVSTSGNAVSVYLGNNQFTPINSTISGYTPPSITGYIPSSKAFCIAGFGYMIPVQITLTQTVIQTVTCSAGSTCIATTATVTQVSFIYSLQSSTGSVAIITDLVTFLPVWIWPILLSPLGMTGLTFGLMMGLIVGGILGIIPFWAILLLGMALLMLMFRHTIF